MNFKESSNPAILWFCGEAVYGNMSFSEVFLRDKSPFSAQRQECSCPWQDKLLSLGSCNCCAWAGCRPGSGNCWEKQTLPHPVFFAYLHLTGFNELPPKPSKIMLSLFWGRWPSNISGGYYINSCVLFHFFLLPLHFLFFILEVKKKTQHKRKQLLTESARLASPCINMQPGSLPAGSTLLSLHTEDN